MRLRRPIAFILSAAVAASALTGCDSFSGHAAAAANSAQVQQLIEFIADLGLERDLRQALQKGGDLRQALLTLLGLESAVNFNVDGLTSARPGQHAVQVWEVTAQSAEDAAALAASQIRAVLEQLKSSGVTEGRIGMVEVDGKYYVVVDVEVTEENTFEPAKPVSDDDDDNDDNGGEEEQQPQGAEATLDKDGKLTITGGSGTLNEETIEKLLSENPNWISTVTTLDLSQSGYTQIGKSDDTAITGVFASCTSLKTVILPTSLESIGNNAFAESGLTEINLSGCTSLRSIGDGAFWNCTSLEEINLSDCINLTSIGGSAFESCEKLTTVTLPSTVTTIGNSAFWYCTSLTSITLPAGLQTIGNSAFRNCTSLEEINLSGCKNLTSIGVGAFYECSSLTEIDLSNTKVKTIDREAFWNCTSLTKVMLPKGLVDINGQIPYYHGAFENCSGLKDITFYNAPETIGTGAFEGVISDADPSDKLTIHCPIDIRNALQEKLTQSGSFTADDFTGGKIEFADIATLTYLLGF